MAEPVDANGAAQRIAAFKANEALIAQREALIAQQEAQARLLASLARTSQFEVAELQRELALKQAEAARNQSLADEYAQGLIAAAPPGGYQAALGAAPVATLLGLGQAEVAAAAALPPAVAVALADPAHAQLAPVPAPTHLAPAPTHLAPAPAPAASPLPLAPVAIFTTPNPIASSNGGPFRSFRAGTGTPATASVKDTLPSTARFGGKTKIVGLGPALPQVHFSPANYDNDDDDGTVSEFDEDNSAPVSLPSRSAQTHSSAHWSCSICNKLNSVSNYQCRHCFTLKSSSDNVDRAFKFNAAFGGGRTMLNDDNDSDDQQPPSPPPSKPSRYVREEDQDDDLYAPADEIVLPPKKKAKTSNESKRGDDFEFPSGSSASGVKDRKDSQLKSRPQVAVLPEVNGVEEDEEDNDEDEEAVARKKSKIRPQPPLPAWVPVQLTQHLDHPVRRLGVGGGWGESLTHWKQGAGAREIASGKHGATPSQREEAQQRIDAKTKANKNQQ